MKYTDSVLNTKDDLRYASDPLTCASGTLSCNNIYPYRTVDVSWYSLGRWPAFRNMSKAGNNLKYITRNMHMVLVCFICGLVTVFDKFSWCMYSYYSKLFHWHREIIQLKLKCKG